MFPDLRPKPVIRAETSRAWPGLCQFRSRRNRTAYCPVPAGNTIFHRIPGILREEGQPALDGEEPGALFLGHGSLVRQDDTVLELEVVLVFPALTGTAPVPSGICAFLPVLDRTIRKYEDCSIAPRMIGLNCSPRRSGCPTRYAVSDRLNRESYSRLS